MISTKWAGLFAVSMISRIRMLLLLWLCATNTVAQTAQDKRPLGEPFRSIFPITGKTSGWWLAEYDHRSDWQQTAWRRSAINFGLEGAEIALSPVKPEQVVSQSTFRQDPKAYVKSGMTSKSFISGQIQRRGWFGYGRYEIIMSAASGSGLITAFYVYTGNFFGDTHEEIDIEILGKDTTKVQFNRFRDGRKLDEAAWLDVGFDTSERPQLYAFEWAKDKLIWYVNDIEMFRVVGAVEIPRPPAKIYLDLWVGGPGQAQWAGAAPKDATGSALVQCVSYAPLGKSTPQCSDLLLEK